MEIRYSGARFGGYHFEYVGIRVWLQTPPSGVLAWVLAWIFVQIFVFTGRWDAQPQRSVERKPGGRCHGRRPVALAVRCSGDQKDDGLAIEHEPLLPDLTRGLSTAQDTINATR